MPLDSFATPVASLPRERSKNQDEGDALVRPPELTLVIPTYNERDNIEALLELLDQALEGESREYLFVDDNSPDGTADEVRRLGRDRSDVRVIERIGKRGLASACADGVMAASSPLVLVMDADLQHDETIIPELLRAVREDEFDVASGSRFGEEKQEIEGLSWFRTILSMVANLLACLVSGHRLRDPMSGFFLFRRAHFMKALPKMVCAGYKVYLDYLCASPRSLRVKEVTFDFRPRRAGESKLDLGVIWENALLLLSKLSFRLFPISFIGYCLVGASGAIVHLCAVFVLFQLLLTPYLHSQIAATIVAMVWNYYWNNTLTYKATRQRGKAFVAGLIKFVQISALGALASVLVAQWLFGLGLLWAAASVAGIVFGAVWNFAVSRWFVWRQPRGV